MDHYNRRAQDAEVAALTVEVATLKQTVQELKEDVKSLLALANQTKGGWKIIVLVASVAGATGALLAKLVPLIGGLPK